jgi:hypothetical protein
VVAAELVHVQLPVGFQALAGMVAAVRVEQQLEAMEYLERQTQVAVVEVAQVLVQQRKKPAVQAAQELLLFLIYPQFKKARAVL